MNVHASDAVKLNALSDDRKAVATTRAPDLGDAVLTDRPRSLSASDGSSAPPATPPYRSAASVPTQQGPSGIRYDFNDGARVVVPTGEATWQVTLRDLDTGNVLFRSETAGGYVNSSKRYYVRFAVQVHRGDTLVFEHNYSAADRDVLIQFPVGTLGDPLAWFPYAVKFKDKHRCRLTCAMSDKLADLLRPAYPDIRFVTHDAVRAENFYATYRVGLFFDDIDHVLQPTDFRHVGLHKTAGYILGVDPGEAAPSITIADRTRPIEEPYVCIAVQSTTQSKYWNNPTGWRDVVTFLREAGYRVLCIDQKPVHGTGLVWNHIPHGAEDFTGDHPLIERARLLAHADFFIGLSSGLSWLAWACGTKVVMISGFTHPTNEFATPYRIINYHACNSCWNDPRVRFDHKDFLWCPRHAGTDRQFECTRLITSDHVKAVISSIPEFQHHQAAL